MSSNEKGGAMSEKRTMTLNLTDREMEALEALAAKKDLSKTAIIRQALRLYQLVADRVEAGAKLLLEDEKANKKSELMVL
jgi:predicted transcriptional regulator